MPPQHFKYIDALRGYAVLGVVATHAQILAPDMPGLLKRYADFGGEGVALFFVVSALTLAQSWNTRDNRPAAFYVRRLFRIAPAFWLAILLYSLFPWVNRDFWAPHGVGPGVVAVTALFLHGWNPETINAIVPGGWSIAVEWGFYLIFPFIMAATKTLRTAAVLCGAALLLTVLLDPVVRAALPAIYPAAPKALLDAFREFWLPGSLFIFLAGVATWHATVAVRVSPSVATGEVLGAGVTLAALPLLGEATHYAAPFAFALLAHGMSCGGGRLLVNRAVQRIGTVSFSVYLWHFAVIMALQRVGVSGWHWHGADFVLIFAGVVGVTWGISEVTYRTVERPIIEAGNALVRRRLAAVVPA